MPTLDFTATGELRLGMDGVIPKHLFDAARAIDATHRAKHEHRRPKAPPYPTGALVWLKVRPDPPVRTALGQDNWAPAIALGHDRLSGRVLIATVRNNHQRYVARDLLRPRLPDEIGPGIRRFGP